MSAYHWLTCTPRIDFTGQSHASSTDIGDVCASRKNVTRQGQQQNSSYQAATDLAFLEKYTLTPQPANVVRADQMLDPREQSYLRTSPTLISTHTDRLKVDL
ncbi:hypothetical protein NQZ68_012708 [Dissostichus eleginoides]|nr:hypothetical protein NQZ68_012708 [Dissostichus eleginoides]